MLTTLELSMVFVVTITAACATLLICERILNTGPKETEFQVARVRAITIFATGALLWPLVWYFAVGRSVMQHQPHTIALFGFVWPAILMSFDLESVKSITNISKYTKLSDGLVADSTQLIGVCFAFGTLCLAASTVQRDGGAPKLTGQTVLLVMFSLCICISFVVPSSLSDNGVVDFTYSSMQRTLYNYAMGFLISAICLHISVF